MQPTNLVRRASLHPFGDSPLFGGSEFCRLCVLPEDVKRIEVDAVRVGWCVGGSEEKVCGILVLQQPDPCFLTLFHGFIWPDAGMNFTDMHFL